jgi:chromosome transmission fidelity protein 4
MKNYFNYTMGSLSKNLVALAGNNPSKLTGITFKAFGSKEWSIDMTDLEEIVAISASDKLVAIATDTRLLRLFSTMGTQREVRVHLIFFCNLCLILIFFHF